MFSPRVTRAISRARVESEQPAVGVCNTMESSTDPHHPNASDDFSVECVDLGFLVEEENSAEDRRESENIVYPPTPQPNCRRTSVCPLSVKDILGLLESTVVNVGTTEGRLLLRQFIIEQFPFLASDENDETQCIVCFGRLEDPTGCGNCSMRACRLCLEQCLGVEEKCPQCRRHLEKRAIKDDEELRTRLEAEVTFSCVSDQVKEMRSHIRTLQSKYVSVKRRFASDKARMVTTEAKAKAQADQLDWIQLQIKGLVEREKEHLNRIQQLDERQAQTASMNEQDKARMVAMEAEMKTQFDSMQLQIKGLVEREKEHLNRIQQLAERQAQTAENTEKKVKDLEANDLLMDSTTVFLLVFFSLLVLTLNFFYFMQNKIYEEELN